jgi:ubiquinone/menaquinone biosynthesis C-methylase UbiE
MNIKTKCSLCSSDQYEYQFSAKDNLRITDKSFDLVKCTSCGVTRLLEPPYEDEMQKYYPEFYFKGEPQPNSPVNKRKKQILEKYVNKGKILDYGCGDCSFLLSLDDKWEKVGFDKNLYVDKTFLEKYKITFLSDSLSNVNLPDDHFDAITLWASIEHTHNPANILKFTYDKLKSGGKLIILCQNINSIQGKLFKKHWLHLDIPRHIYQFSTKTLKATLKKFNFKIIEVIHNNPEYNIPGFTDSFRIFINSHKKILFSNSQPETCNIKTDSDICIEQSKFMFNKIFLILIKIFFAYPSAFIEILAKKGGIITIVAEK